MIKLNKFKKKNIYRGKNCFTQISWYVINNLLFNSFLPFNKLKIIILRLFGATIGNNVILKNYIRIKFPWNLYIGDNVWIGESAWIDNISDVIIENNCCISQGAYICTGNHNFFDESFELTSEKIVIRESSWICAKAILMPGVVIKKNSFIKAGSLVKKNQKQHIKFSSD